MQVNWHPWGTRRSKWPQYVKDSIPATQKRILLVGSAGRAWYLGERVSVQSLNTEHPKIPHKPPSTMLDGCKLEGAELMEAVVGKPAIQFVKDGDYDAFREKNIKYKAYPKLHMEVKEQMASLKSNNDIVNKEHELIDYDKN